MAAVEERAFQARGPDVRYSLEVGFLEAAPRRERSTSRLPHRQPHSTSRSPRELADGETIRLQGKGGEGFDDHQAGWPAHPPSRVAPHAFPRREGDDIVAGGLPITLDEAVLGGKVEVPTIEQPVALTIPKGA